MRLVRLVEVVDVAPIRWDCLFTCPLLEEFSYERAFPRPSGPKREQVVAFLLDTDAKAHRLNRPRLTDDIGQFF